MPSSDKEQKTDFEKLFSTQDETALLMGNHAVTRAILETQTQVITTYPGSPTPEIASPLTTIPEADRRYYFEYAINEKVALEIAAGASINGHLSCVFFKSVGLNVASDSLIQQSLMNQVGGLIIVLGDDPGANSSQNEQDNRHFSKMAYLPMLEPASPQEAYDMYKEAARLSVSYQMPLILRLTTHVCHARQPVKLSGYRPKNINWQSKYHKKNGPYFPVTNALFPLKQAALKKIDAIAKYNNDSSFNQILAQPDHSGTDTKRGIISAGLPAMAAKESCITHNAPIRILKLAMTYPLPKRLIIDFLNKHDEVLIIEELDPVLETSIKAIAYDGGCRCKIFARNSTIDLMGELTTPRTLALLTAVWPNLFKTPHILSNNVDDNSSASNRFPVVSNRLPQLCPGCGHRSAFYALNQVLPKDGITVGDIGCHTLGAFPPYNLGEILFSMGHSVSTGAGLALNNPNRKVVALMGDSTLFHAGLPGVINAAATNANLVLYLLDNGTTAMTGHQPRPGAGEIGPKIDLPTLFEHLGVTFIRQADAYNLKKQQAHLKEAMDHQGFSVVIAKHPCMLQFTKKQRKQNPTFKTKPIVLDQAKCNHSLDCITDFGCPSFERREDGTIGINTKICIGCGACISICPAGALSRAATNPQPSSQPPKGKAK